MTLTKTRIGFVRLALAGSISALAIGCAMPAFAQSASPQAADATDAKTENSNADIVVTAQFRKEKLQDTPIAITAVNADTMEARSQTNLAQVADSAPNVTIKPQGASFGPSITASIRGVGQNDFNPAFEPGVGIYIDDVYYPQLTGAVFDLLDLDRVEILRGPQGTLSGRNSEGGAIKMFSKLPTGDNSGSVEATYGSRNRIGLRASADFKLADNLSARISGVFKRQEGYVDQLDFGCVYPAGGSATFTANDGTTKLVNPAGGIAAVKPAGNCRVAKLGGVGYQAVRAMVRYAPTSDFSLTLSADYTHDEHTVPGEVLIGTGLINNVNTNVNGVPYDNRFICGQFCNFATTSQPAGTYFGLRAGVLPGTAPVPIQATSGTNQSKYDGYNLGANLHVGLSEAISVDNILAYQHFTSSFDSDDDLSPIPLNLGQNQLSHYNWSEELRVNIQPIKAVSVVLGGYYFKQNTSYYSVQDIRYITITPNTYGASSLGLEPLQFIQPDYTPADSKAAFANLNVDLTEKLKFNGGLRYTEENKQYHYFRLNLDGTINPFLDPVGAANGAGYSGVNGTALTGSVARYHGTRTDFRAALDYRFSPELLVYASAASGFKGGGTNPRPFNAGQVISFNPEILYNYEVGLKSDLFDRKLRFNLTGFYGILRGAQIPVLACPDSPCAARLNAGNAHEKGFEAELTAHPAQGLLVDASLSYLDFHYTSLVPSAEYPTLVNGQASGGTNSAGALPTDPAAGAPKWKYNIGAQYEITLPGIGSITPRIDYDYQGKLYTGPSVVGGVRSLTYIPAYGVGNARLTFRNENKDVEIALEVTNFTDKYYYLTDFNLIGAGAGFNKVQPGHPREWAVSVKKKF